MADKDQAGNNSSDETDWLEATTMKVFPWLTLSLIAFLLIPSARAADDPVSINQQPISSTTKYYDPQNFPPEMPPRFPNEAGVTVSEFGAEAEVGGVVTDHYKQQSDTFATIRIDSVKIKLHLKVVEWIDSTAGPKILAHEDGHRKISQRFYDPSDKVADAIGRAMIGRTITAAGDDVNSAAQNALHGAAEQIAQRYMSEVSVVSQHVQEAYDRITEHGTNAIDESDAIEQAMKEVMSSQK